MGSWFSNLQIRKTEGITKKIACNCIKDTLEAKEYELVECEQDADIVVAVMDSPNSQWISICSQAFAHDDPESCKEAAAALSAQLHTDVLGIACFDSDYLYLNLINTQDSVDAWIGVGAGKEVGISRRSNLTAWKKKVADFAAFSAAAKCSYICADEFLTVVERCLDLPAEQGSISLDYLKDSVLQKNAVFLYFRQKEILRPAGPSLQIIYMRYAFPCFDNKENSVYFLNYGDEFHGLSIYFLGPYVAQEEIIFSDVRLSGAQQPTISIELKKTQLSDGQWAYCCHIPDILIPPGVPRRMKPEKRRKLEDERVRRLAFVPHGNPRKMLDITVLIVPDGNSDYQAKWNICHPHGSKEAFITFHNKIWKRVSAFETDPNQLLPFLKLEDFDE